ncbi:hypothetical protein [Kitasatospora sp. NPDC085879]|uniref:hypothetical protein n=1 Tax=Kitasatospora sp. NPDC085879 TaxID=3154769 RepID=UPI003440CE03
MLRLIAGGSTNREIAARLYLGEGTVKNPHLPHPRLPRPARPYTGRPVRARPRPDLIRADTPPAPHCGGHNHGHQRPYGAGLLVDHCRAPCGRLHPCCACPVGEQWSFEARVVLAEIVFTRACRSRTVRCLNVRHQPPFHCCHLWHTALRMPCDYAR